MGGRCDMSSIDTSQWQTFRLEDLFEKVNHGKIQGKASDFSKERTKDYTIPLRTASVSNKGLSCYAHKEHCPVILKNVISVSGNGDAVAYYHKDEFAILQDAYALELKGKVIPNEEVGLYLEACINKLLVGNFGWTNKSTWNRIKDLEIKLPVTEVEEPDWEYMEKYIKAIEKLVIKDVVDYKNDFLTKTKQVVEDK